MEGEKRVRAIRCYAIVFGKNREILYTYYIPAPGQFRGIAKCVPDLSRMFPCFLSVLYAPGYGQGPDGIRGISVPVMKLPTGGFRKSA